MGGGGGKGGVRAITTSWFQMESGVQSKFLGISTSASCAGLHHDRHHRPFGTPPQHRSFEQLCCDKSDMFNSPRLGFGIFAQFPIQNKMDSSLRGQPQPRKMLPGSGSNWTADPWLNNDRRVAKYDACLETKNPSLPNFYSVIVHSLVTPWDQWSME